jgi:hypothetical protein
MRCLQVKLFLPPAARGRFLKKLPPGPWGIRKNFLLKAVMVCNLKESMQAMTAFSSLNIRRLKNDFLSG